MERRKTILNSRPRHKEITLALSLSLCLAVWTFDGMTEANFGFSIFYLPVVLMVSWELGWWWSTIVSIVCAALWLNVELGYRINYLHPLVPYWNALVRLGFFLVSGNLLHRLRVEHERRASLILQLQEAMANIKTLKGLVPICSWCKKVRDDEGFWSQVERYVELHSEAHFTHGICPDCLQKVEKETTKTLNYMTRRKTKNP